MRQFEFLKKYRVLLLFLGFLVFLTPLAFKVAEHFNFGDAWGEWSSKDIGEMSGITPEGMKKLEGIYDKAPLPDYSLPDKKIISGELAYLLSGLAGIILIFILFFGAMKVFSKKGYK